MALDDGAARILRQNLPEECLDGGAPRTAALIDRPESTARAMDLMEMKIEALQQELARLVQGSGAGPAANGGRALAAHAAQLRRDVKDIDARLGEVHGSVGPALELPIAAVESSASERAELLEQVQTHDQLASIMAALSLFKTTVAQYDADAAAGDLAAAARGVCVLEDMLREEPLANLAEDGARSIGTLASMVASKRAELSEAAIMAVRQSFVVGRRGSGADMMVRCRFRSVLPTSKFKTGAESQPSNAAPALQLPVVWTCLKTLGGDLVTTSVRQVAEALHSHFIDPLFSKPLVVQEGEPHEAAALGWELQVDDVVRKDGSFEESAAATLRLKPLPSTPDDATGHAEVQLLDPLARLVQALHAVTCSGDPDMCSAFGSEMWPRLAEQLAESGCLHAQDAEAVGIFETRLREIGFVVELGEPAVATSAAATSTGSATAQEDKRVAASGAESTAAASSLTGHVEGLRHREAKQACAQLLNRAREALVSGAGDTALEAQRETVASRSSLTQTALFAFPVCETSTAAQSTIALMEECVQLAASRYADEPGTANVALQSIDQLLDLFRVTRAGDNAVGPGPAAVLHNDYMLLAHCCLTLGVEFRPALSRCSFVDRVPKLRTLAATAFDGYTSIVESELRAHFVETRSFAEIWEEDRAAMASKALAKILYELQKLGRVWAPPVLPASTYALAIGGLLGKVAGWIVASVLRLAEEDLLCYKPGSLESLYSTITPFVEQAPGLMKSIDAGRQSDATLHEEICWTAAGTNWRRCRACHALIKPERKDVGALWRSGGLLAELTDVECVNFLRALAEETPARLETEREIRKGRVT